MPEREKVLQRTEEGKVGTRDAGRGKVGKRGRVRGIVWKDDPLRVLETGDVTFRYKLARLAWRREGKMALWWSQCPFVG